VTPEKNGMPDFTPMGETETLIPEKGDGKKIGEISSVPNDDPTNTSNAIEENQLEPPVNQEEENKDALDNTAPVDPKPAEDNKGEELNATASELTRAMADDDKKTEVKEAEGKAGDAVTKG
jgi:hypothetical protein